MTCRPDFTLVAVGDVSLGDSPQCVGDGVHTRFERFGPRRPRYPFTHVAPLFEGADLVFGNLETVLSHAGLQQRNVASLQMRGHPEAAERLAVAGFTAVSVANNHILQHGDRAFAETLAALERVGVAPVGVANRDGDGCVPVVLSRAGARVALLGYAFEPDKYYAGRPLYAFGPASDMEAQIAEARRAADVVLCSVHWGVEYLRYPGPVERQLGRRLVEAGADVVLGHHPHVARGVERYRQGVIAYSLGNFVFDMLWTRSLRLAPMLRVAFPAGSGPDVTTSFAWIDDDYEPRPLTAAERDAAADEFRAVDAETSRERTEAEYARDYERSAAESRYRSYAHFWRRTLARPAWATRQILLETARRKLGTGR